MPTQQTIGILGAGKLGITVAQLGIRAGYKVLVAGSGPAEKIALAVQVLAPGAAAMNSKEVAAQADIIILALPLGKYKNIPAEQLRGKLVIDAMNYWWEVDGPRDSFIDPDMSSSAVVAAFLPNSRVVKALNHMGYHNLHDEPRHQGVSGRKAIALAGDSEQDIQTVSKLIDNLGFDPLPICNLSKGKILEPGHPAFGANLPAADLQKILAS